MAESDEPRSEAAAPKKKKKSSKSKDLHVAMEAITESEDRIAPVVGYFPSGYHPQGAAAEPHVRVFRNTKRTSRLELVVSPPGSNVDFVGKSYAGEAAGPQICTYALGVLDKSSQTLKIVPIAANKVFRLEPRFMANKASEAEPSENLTEEKQATEKTERRIADLTSLYGTKKDRDRDNKWRSLWEQHDPAAHELHENQSSVADTDNNLTPSVKETTARNIPPHDPSADTPEKAYLLDEIISKSDRSQLLYILEDLDSGEDFASKNYPAFVSKRSHKLNEIQDQEEKEKLACILSYITHLHSFWERQKPSGHKSKLQQSQPVDRPKIPRTLNKKLLTLFVDPESQMVSTEKMELLIGYILVLTLFADNFKSDPKDIAADLKMTVQRIKLYYRQLGCRFVAERLFQPGEATLPVPLKFPDLVRRKRRG